MSEPAHENVTPLHAERKPIYRAEFGHALPRLSDHEYAALRDDIAANGVRVPIDVDEDGRILDGHHRVNVAVSLGIIDDIPRRVIEGLTREQKHEHALVVNVARRQLTREQKRDLIGRELERDDTRSDRAIARLIGVDHKTVGSVRSQRKLDTMVDTVRAKQRRESSGPAAVPERITPKETRKVRYVTKDDEDRGEVPQRFVTISDPLVNEPPGGALFKRDMPLVLNALERSVITLKLLNNSYYELSLGMYDAMRAALENVWSALRAYAKEHDLPEPVVPDLPDDE